jgi:hypothetical protein
MIRSLTVQIGSTSGDDAHLELEVIFSRWDQFDNPDTQRPEFQYRVGVPGDPSHETVAYGHDLRLGSGEGIDHVKAMECLLTFLQSDADKYRAGLDQPHYGGQPNPTSDEAQLARTGDGYTFNALTAEIAYMLSEELGYALEELRDKSGDDPARELALASEALDAVARELSGVSWNADTVERIAAIVGLTGRTIKDVSEADDDDDHLPRMVVGTWYGWQLRHYARGMVGAPSAKWDAMQVHGVGMSPGCESMAELFEWLEQEEAERREQSDEADWINVGSCACSSGARERALYGNVHTDDELGR